MVYKYMTQYNMREITLEDIQKVIKNYNNTPHTTTHQVPAQVHNGNTQAVSIACQNIKTRTEKLVAESLSAHSHPYVWVIPCMLPVELQANSARIGS
jgi:hypothetical protein